MITWIEKGKSGFGRGGLVPNHKTCIFRWISRHIFFYIFGKIISLVIPFPFLVIWLCCWQFVPHFSFDCPFILLTFIWATLSLVLNAFCHLALYLCCINTIYNIRYIFCHDFWLSRCFCSSLHFMFFFTYVVHD